MKRRAVEVFSLENDLPLVLQGVRQDALPHGINLMGIVQVKTKAVLLPVPDMLYRNLLSLLLHEATRHRGRTCGLLSAALTVTPTTRIRTLTESPFLNEDRTGGAGIGD